MIRDVPDEAAIAMALIENIQREDLNPLEEARALERLIAEFGLTHQQVASAVGRSRAAVTNLLRLLELAPEVCTLLEERAIDMGHARALLGLENRRKQIEVAALVAKKGLSVRDTEALVRRLSEPQGPKGGEGGAGSTKDPNVRRLEEDLSGKLGARVQIQHGAAGRGKVIVNYNNLEELDGILATSAEVNTGFRSVEEGTGAPYNAPPFEPGERTRASGTYSITAPSQRIGPAFRSALWCRRCCLLADRERWAVRVSRPRGARRCGSSPPRRR